MPGCWRWICVMTAWHPPGPVPLDDPEAGELADPTAGSGVRHSPITMEEGLDLLPHGGQQGDIGLAAGGPSREL